MTQVPDGRVLKIWLLGTEDSSIDIECVRKAEGTPSSSNAPDSGRNAANGQPAKGGGMDVARWRAYMESYVLHHPTELVGDGVRGGMQRTYLSRCVSRKRGSVLASHVVLFC